VDERWLEIMMSAVGSHMEQDTITYQALSRIMSDDNLLFIHDTRNRVALQTDPDIVEENIFGEIFDLVPDPIEEEELPTDFLRGLALGIATCLESDIRGFTAPPLSRMHREMVAMYDAIQAILIERSVDT
tara:strand:- start:160 stop:549 length:390 start_codon:yes stop_codon:yes gene_type:complete